MRTKTSPAQAFTFVEQEAVPGNLELEAEKTDARKAVYLVTLAHPVQSHSACGVQLRSPDTYSRQWLRNVVLDVFAHPVYNDVGNQTQHEGRGVSLVRFAVAAERHEAGTDGQRHWHYHVALQAQESVRFLPFKRSFLQRWGLATHWSVTHVGYWSALRYLVWPSPTKPERSLDPEVQKWAWQQDGPHGPVKDVAQPPTNATMIEARRQKNLTKAAETGTPEAKPREIDVWPIVVKHGIRNDHDNQDGWLRLIKVATTACSPSMASFLFSIRHRLNKLIDDIWTWETIDDRLHLSQRSRMTALEEAMRAPCVCGGAWRHHVSRVLSINGISESELAHDIYVSVSQGRSETTPVITLVGLRGGEGKSLIFYPMEAVFGEDLVQGHTASGSFPMLGIEGKKVVLLDEWRFAASALPLSIQLLWFEGKPVPVARPQGEYIGHLMYKGSAPIFITTPWKRFEKLETDAETAVQTGGSSEASMVLRRLKVHKFRHKVPQPPSQIAPCAACFACFVFEGEMAWSHT